MTRSIPRGWAGLRAERLAGGEAKGGAKGGWGRVGVDGLYRARCRRCHVTRGKSRRRCSGSGGRSKDSRVGEGLGQRMRVEGLRVVSMRVGRAIGMWTGLIVGVLTFVACVAVRSGKHKAQGRDANAGARCTELYRVRLLEPIVAAARGGGRSGKRGSRTPDGKDRQG
jgi:hypothetical protein